MWREGQASRRRLEHQEGEVDLYRKGISGGQGSGVHSCRGYVEHELGIEGIALFPLPVFVCSMQLRPGNEAKEGLGCMSTEWNNNWLGA